MKPICTFGLVLVAAGVVLGQEGPASAPDSLATIFDSNAAVEPMGASTASAAFNYVVAHFPYGGGWSTLVMFANNSGKTATANVTFFTQAGASAGVPLAGKGTQSTQQITIKSNDVQVMGADTSKRNSGNLQVAWATVASNQPLNVFSLFDYGPNPPAISGAVGAQSTAASKSFSFPVSINGPLGYNAGMAIANPNSSNTDVTVTVFDQNGNKKGSFKDTLQASNQTIFTLTQKLPNSFSSSLFTGSVSVCASQPIGLVTVGFEGGQAFFTTSVSNPSPCPQ